MFKIIIDGVTLIAGICTIFAAIATIYGVCFAVRGYGEWKKSFKYERVVNFDTLVNKIKREVENGLRSFYLHRLGLINNHNCEENKERYQTSLEKLEELISQYDVMGEELRRIGVDDLADNMPAPVDIYLLVFKVHVNNMERITEKSKLDDYYYGVVDKNENLLKKMNEYLDRLKK